MATAATAAMAALVVMAQMARLAWMALYQAMRVELVKPAAMAAPVVLQVSVALQVPAASEASQGQVEQTAPAETVVTAVLAAMVLMGRTEPRRAPMARAVALAAPAVLLAWAVLALLVARMASTVTAAMAAMAALVTRRRPQG